MEGNFALPLRPDLPPKRKKPFTMPGAVNDEWRRSARWSRAFALVALVTGGALGYAGLSLSKAPPVVMGIVTDRTGMVVRAGFIDEDPDLDEITARASLAEMVFNLRRFVPDEPRMKEQFDRVSTMFRNAGAVRMRVHLMKVRAAYKKAVTDGMRRVVEEPVNARLLLAAANAGDGSSTYRIDWIEYWVDRRGVVVPESRRPQWMEVRVVKDTGIEPALRRYNIAAVFVEDWQSSIAD